MYYCKESGLVEYETADEILNADINKSWEDSENYYFKIDSKDVHDETVWIINKSTKDVSQMHYIDFIMQKKSKTKPIDAISIRESLS